MATKSQARPDHGGLAGVLLSNCQNVRPEQICHVFIMDVITMSLVSGAIEASKMIHNANREQSPCSCDICAIERSI